MFRPPIVVEKGGTDDQHALGMTESLRQRTSGALEQADTEPLLQRSDAPAEARFLHADSSCRRRKAPVLNDRSKEVDVVQIIHRLLLICINLLQQSHLVPKSLSEYS